MKHHANSDHATTFHLLVFGTSRVWGLRMCGKQYTEYLKTPEKKRGGDWVAKGLGIDCHRMLVSNFISLAQQTLLSNHHPLKLTNRPLQTNKPNLIRPGRASVRGTLGLRSAAVDGGGIQ